MLRQAPRYYPLIDLLRGIAALLVLWYHVIEVGGWKEFPQQGIAQLLRAGWVGVDLFFVISGFVIGKSAIEGWQRGGNWRALFAERRLRRIVPLYIATLAAYLFLVDPDLLRRNGETVLQLLSHLTFLHNLSIRTHGTIDGPNWSVALEMQFYLLMALSTPWIARAPWWKVFLAWTGVAISWRFATTLVLPPGPSDPFTQQVAATQLPGVLDQFVCGICLAKLALAGQLDYRPRRLLAWALVAAVLLAAAWLTFWPRAPYWFWSGMVIFWRTLLSAAFAALLACIVMLPGSGGWLSKPFRYLGEISYGIYLWHLPVLMTIIEKTPLRGHKLLAATLVCTVVLAALSWHGFEKLWLKSRAVGRPEPEPAPAGTATPGPHLAT